MKMICEYKTFDGNTYATKAEALEYLETQLYEQLKIHATNIVMLNKDDIVRYLKDHIDSLARLKVIKDDKRITHEDEY